MLIRKKEKEITEWIKNGKKAAKKRIKMPEIRT